MINLIETWLDGFPDVASAIAHLEGHNVPCAPVLSVKETLVHPHFLERGTVRTVTDPIAGTFQIPGMPIKTSDYSAELPYVAPLLGEHNAEIPCELLGKDASEVEALMAACVLVSGRLSGRPRVERQLAAANDASSVTVIGFSRIK